MKLDEFVVNFTELFDDTDPSEITPSTVFHDLEEWSSLMGMSCIALAKTEYDKSITGAELRECVTVEDLFNLIDKK